MEQANLLEYYSSLRKHSGKNVCFQSGSWFGRFCSSAPLSPDKRSISNAGLGVPDGASPALLPCSLIQNHCQYCLLITCTSPCCEKCKELSALLIVSSQSFTLMSAKPEQSLLCYGLSSLSLGQWNIMQFLCCRLLAEPPMKPLKVWSPGSPLLHPIYFCYDRCYPTAWNQFL